MKKRWLAPVPAAALLAVGAEVLPRELGARERFTYVEPLFGPVKTLSVHLARVDRQTGEVACNGYDAARPSTPFAWDWGDGTRTTGFFPQSHSYRDTGRSYRIRVTARYADGRASTVETLARFAPPASLRAPRVKLAEGVRVTVPREMPALRAARAPYGVPGQLTPFEDRFFPRRSRSDVERILTLAASVQVEMANGDVCRTNGRFEQVALRHPGFPGMHALWYTEPGSFGVGDDGFGDAISWSSLFHEMGHNVTLNTPARFHWGLRQDGPANAIYSETMAQIFAHATAYELLNRRDDFGLPDDLAAEIGESALQSMAGVRRAHEQYRREGCRFHSWNAGSTQGDETLPTFMTVAHTFFVHAERDGQGYRKPVQRLMAFLQRFNPEWGGASAHARTAPRPRPSARR